MALSDGIVVEKDLVSDPKEAAYQEEGLMFGVERCVSCDGIKEHLTESEVTGVISGLEYTCAKRDCKLPAGGQTPACYMHPKFRDAWTEAFRSGLDNHVLNVGVYLNAYQLIGEHSPLGRRFGSILGEIPAKIAEVLTSSTYDGRTPLERIGEGLKEVFGHQNNVPEELLQLFCDEVGRELQRVLSDTVAAIRDNYSRMGEAVWQLTANAVASQDIQMSRMSERIGKLEAQLRVLGAEKEDE